MIFLKKITNILLALSFLFGPLYVMSQGYYNRYEYRRKRHEISFGGGASNFLGELGGRDMVGSGFLWDIEFAKTSYVGQFSYMYYALSKLAFRGNICVSKVSGDDALTAEFYRNNRNLNFESMIIEGGLFMEVHLKHERTGNRYNLRSPAGRYLGMRNPIGIGIYLFSGVAGFYFDPQGQSPSGVKYRLKPLKTEGQGLPGGESGCDGSVADWQWRRLSQQGQGGATQMSHASRVVQTRRFAEIISSVQPHNGFARDAGPCSRAEDSCVQGVIAAEWNWMVFVKES